MSKKRFNRYLKKYESKFRAGTILKADDGIYNIHGKYGSIGPYAPDKGLLAMWYMDRPDLKTNTRRKNILLDALRDANVLYELHQDGDVEFGIIFHESQLDLVASIIKATKKKKMPQKQKDVLHKHSFANKNSKKSRDKYGIMGTKFNDIENPHRLFQKMKNLTKIDDLSFDDEVELKK